VLYISFPILIIIVLNYFHCKNLLQSTFFNLLFNFIESFRSFIYSYFFFCTRIVQEIGFSNFSHFNSLSNNVIKLRLEFIMNLGNFCAILIQITFNLISFLFSRIWGIESFCIYDISFDESSEDFLHVFLIKWIVIITYW